MEIEVAEISPPEISLSEIFYPSYWALDIGPMGKFTINNGLETKLRSE